MTADKSLNKSNSQNLSANVIDDVNPFSQLDTAAQPTKVAKLDDSVDKEKNFAEIADDEKDFIRLGDLVKFLLKELEMYRPSDEARMWDLMDVLLIRGQMVKDQNKIGRNQALRALTEKIEIKIALDKYF